jgi:phage gp36-like protein
VALTVEQFLGRFEASYVRQLLGLTAGAAIDEARLLRAIDDAVAELDGYAAQLAPEKQPSAATRRVHEVKVATYLLTLNRPGAEFEQIRNAYTDTIAFYTSQIAAAVASGGTPLAVTTNNPTPVFNDDTLKRFV